jgi:hypothetical protein
MATLLASNAKFLPRYDKQASSAALRFSLIVRQTNRPLPFGKAKTGKQSSKLFSTNQTVGIVYQDHFILFEHRYQDILQRTLPQLTFVKLCFHRLARREVGKAAHKGEDVGVFDRKEWSPVSSFLSPPAPRRLRSEYVQNSERHSGLVLYVRISMIIELLTARLGNRRFIDGETQDILRHFTRVC